MMFASELNGILAPLASALLHFLWQGSIVALATLVALRLLRDHDPRIRYALSCGALLIMGALPVITFGLKRASTAVTGLELPVGLATPGNNPQTLLLAVVGVWLVGVAVASLRHLRAWAVVRGWTASPGAIDPDLAYRLTSLADRMGLNRAVRVVVSTRVDVPTAVGWLRPVVIVPVSALTGLPAAQLDALLAHELAHIKRHDYLVNLIQLVVETVLFYHPGVWWVSRQIRIERENCCDDLAVACCGDQRTYLQALAGLESLRSPAPVLSMSAKGGSLVSRVRRLVTQSPSRNSSPAVVMAVGLLLVSLTAGIYACETPTRTGESETAATTDDAAKKHLQELEEGAGDFLIRVEMEDGSTEDLHAIHMDVDDEGRAVFELKGGETMEWVSADGEMHTVEPGKLVVDTLADDGHNTWVDGENHHQKLMKHLAERGDISLAELNALNQMHGQESDGPTLEISEERMQEIKILIHEAMGLPMPTGELHERQ